MKILKLAKNKIYLEDEIIDVSKDIIYTYSLTVDMDITNIYYQLIFESMKYKALYILGLKSRTEFELKNKLKEKYSKKHFNIIEDVIKKLKDMYLIDDYEYTTSYVKYNMNKGRNKVKKYLLSKGVSVNMIDEVFSEFSEEIYSEEKKKIGEIIEKNADIPIVKLFRKLLSRGYSYSVINEVIKTKLKQFGFNFRRTNEVCISD